MNRPKIPPCIRCGNAKTNPSFETCSSGPIDVCIVLPIPPKGMLDAHKFGVRVECVLCFRTKPPLGRSVATELENSMCDPECAGYRQPPFVGSLWPNESEEMFGYPVGDIGVRWIPEEAEPS